MEKLLRKLFQFKEIGWADIGERFTRYAIWRTRWFNVYLHQLYAPNWHPECHDHPWGFVALLLWRGYLERVPSARPCACQIVGRYWGRPEGWHHALCVRTKDVRRYPGQILFRPATFTHNVITPYGTSWSLVITTAKSRDWGFKPCDHHAKPTPYLEYIQKQEKMS